MRKNKGISKLNNEYIENKRVENCVRRMMKSEMEGKDFIAELSMNDENLSKYELIKKRDFIGKVEVEIVKECEKFPKSSIFMGLASAMVAVTSFVTIVPFVEEPETTSVFAVVGGVVAGILSIFLAHCEEDQEKKKIAIKECLKL